MFDCIVVGGGAAGLFFSGFYPGKCRGLLIEKGNSVGKKLLMSGKGQCNFTHEGTMPQFISCYGKQGKKIRSLLYTYNNIKMIDSFNQLGISSITTDQGKVFPQSLKARDVVDCLLKESKNNGFDILYHSEVTSIEKKEDYFKVEINHKDIVYGKKVIIATGGKSYPTTGSDGSMFSLLSSLNIAITPLKPALSPIMVYDYPYSDLAGCSVSNVEIIVGTNSVIGDCLMTHQGFSGPAILNASRYGSNKELLTIRYLRNDVSQSLLNYCMQSDASIINSLSSFINKEEQVLPRRLIEAIIMRCLINPSTKAKSIAHRDVKKIIYLLHQDCFMIDDVGDYNKAMVTTGGVDLEELSLKTMECKKIRGLYCIGEAVDVDGDTGGYNLQFAYSSACAASSDCSRNVDMVN